MIKRTNLYRDSYHKVDMQWEYKCTGRGGIWRLKGGLFSDHLCIERNTPDSRYLIMFDRRVIAVEKTLTEAKHRALAEMSILLHQEKHIVGIHEYYAGLRRETLKRWKDGKI